MKWPLLHVVLLYAAGVLLGNFLGLPVLFLFAGAFACLFLALASRRIRIICLGMTLFLAGWTNYALRTAVLSPSDLRLLVGRDPRLAEVRGFLSETPYLRVFEAGKEPVWRTLARIEVSEIRLDKKQWQRAFGRIAVATPGMLTNLFGGQEVQVSGVISLPQGPIADGTFDYRSFLRRQGIYFRVQADEPQDWTILRSPARPPLADRFREWGRQVLARGLPFEDEALRLEWALTLGWKTALTEEASEPFIQAATYHIFAVDGLRMAIVFGILFGLLRACSVPRWLCGLLLVPFIWFYVALTGWPASAIRATVMLSVIIAGWVLKRPSNLLNSLFAAALIILVWDPQQLFQAGFQLSFLVVLCMVLMLPPFWEWLHQRLEPDPLLPVTLRRKWPAVLAVPARFCADLLVTSLVAWIGSIPLVAYYFNIVTPVSGPANVLAVPLCGLVLMSNLGSLLLAPWFSAAAELFNHAGWFLMECIRLSSIWFAAWPKAWFYVPAPGTFTIALYYALLLGFVTGWLLRPKLRWMRLSFAAAAIAAWCATLVPGWFVTRLTILPAQGGLVTWVDENSRKNDLLVDTGNTNGLQFVTKPFLRAQGVNEIRALALSHGDLHHVGGAGILTRHFKVGHVWISPLRFRSTAYRRLVKNLADEPDCLRTVALGDSLSGWEILHPAIEDKFPRADDGALVLRRTIQGTRVLLLSDLGRAGQQKLLERTPNLKSDIIVAGLPAAGEPLRQELLDAIQPKLIIIADSEYPVSERARPRLCERLNAHGCPVIYTRTTGAITIEFRKRRWKVLPRQELLPDDDRAKPEVFVPQDEDD